MKYTFKDALMDVLHPNRRDYEVNIHGQIVSKNKDKNNTPTMTLPTWQDITGTKKYEPKNLPDVFKFALISWLNNNKSVIDDKYLKFVSKEVEDAYFEILEGTFSYNLGNTLVYTDRMICLASICEVICNKISFDEYKRATGIDVKKVTFYNQFDEQWREYNSEEFNIIGENETYGDDRCGGRTPDTWWIIAHAVINHVDINKVFPGGYKWFLDDKHPTSLIREIYFAYLTGKDTKVLIESECVEVREAFNDGVDVTPYIATIKKVFNSAHSLFKPYSFKVVRRILKSVHYALLSEVDPAVIKSIIEKRGEEYIKTTSTSDRQIKKEGFSDNLKYDRWQQNKYIENVRNDLIAASAGLL